jgi:hypothetical protein
VKNSNDTIGYPTRDLPTCSAVPQTTATPGATDDDDDDDDDDNDINKTANKCNWQLVLLFAHRRTFSLLFHVQKV